MNHLSEKEIQSYILNLIGTGQLLQQIQGKEALYAKVKGDDSPYHLPGFEIDFQLLSKYTRSAVKVLEVLEGMVLISGESIQNISLRKDTAGKRERLYPDILMGNPQTSSFYIMELKKDKQSEREAITELLAYAMEVKNHLPNISDREINLIILSTGFNTLLDHAIISTLLGTHFNILAIKVSTTEDANISLEVYQPEGWTDIWQNTLPAHTFTSVTLVPHTASGKEKKEVEQQFGLLEILEDIIMYEGARNNSHGFYLFWENVQAGEGEPNFCVTLYQINPFLFLKESIQAGLYINSNTPLSRFIREHALADDSGASCNSLMEMANQVKSFMDQFYDTKIEDFSSWNQHMEPGSAFREKASPFQFNAWGNIGDYIRYYYFHPSYKEMKIINDQPFSPVYYKSPLYGIEMINRICGLILFKNGRFTASELYKFGKQFKYYEFLSSIFYQEKIRNQKIDYLRPLLLFAAIDISSSQREIGDRFINSKNIFPPEKGLEIFFYDVDKDPSSGFQTYIEWFENSFLAGNSTLAAHFYPLRYNSILFHPEIKKIFAHKNYNEFEEQYLPKVKEGLVEYVKDVLPDLLATISYPPRDEREKSFITLLQSAYFKERPFTFPTDDSLNAWIAQLSEEDIVNTFETHFIRLLDHVIPEAFHPLIPLGKEFGTTNEWSTLRSHLKKRFQEGDKYPAIHIHANGTIAVGTIAKEYRQMIPVEDPNKEVFLVIHESGGYSHCTKTTWQQIESGEAFPQ